MNSLNTKVYIVTGSATGIGAACAIQFASQGANVLVNYSKNSKDADEVVKTCQSYGVDAIAVRGDVSNDGDCGKIAQAAIDRWGKIDGLVNNAGITIPVPLTSLELVKTEDFLKILNVNLIGAFQMARAVAPALKSSGSGTIVNVSSLSSKTGLGSSIAYACSKGAMNTLTLSLARALAPAIRVNAVCPGFVETKWYKELFGASYETKRIQVSEGLPLKVNVTADDVAKSVLWLSSSDLKITGEILTIDSGLHLGHIPKLQEPS